MGTWGTGPFDNDSAADYADTITALADQPDTVTSHLETTLTSPHPDQPEETVAACAIVADRCAPTFPGRVFTAHAMADNIPLDRIPDVARLVPDALTAIGELRPAADGWRDAAHDRAWLASLDKIAAVLASCLTYAPTAAADITDEIADAAYEIADGWYQGTRIDWEDLLERLDRQTLADGRAIDMGDSLTSPAITELKKRVRAMRRSA